MDPPGILMLQSVRKVFKLAGIKPESILFQKEQFDASNIIDALTNDPKKCPVITTADFTDFFKDGTTPPFNKHVMITADALKGSEFLLSETPGPETPNNCARVLCRTLERILCNKQKVNKNKQPSTESILDDEWFIKCKNSYGNDPDQPGKIQYWINIKPVDTFNR